MKSIGKNFNRLDALHKVKGKTKYTDDFFQNEMLHAKIFRSTIAFGKVTSIDTSKAKAYPGVVDVFTFEDVPENKFATAGHAWSLNPAARDKFDRNLLTGTIRYYGDDIAVVVAESEFIAERALELIEVTYDEYEPILTPADAVKEGAKEIHEGSKNIIAKSDYEKGNIEETFKNAAYTFEDQFKVNPVQHGHIETQVSYAYIDENDKITVVSSTQIPHIARRIIGQALNMPWGKIRVVKPYIGGGFGAKQDVVQEPLNAFLTLKLGGRPVKINYTREESLAQSRVRHAMNLKVGVAFDKEGKLLGSKLNVESINGGYASHGHSVTGNTGNKFKQLYKQDSIRFDATTFYTNMPAAGAMRGYGVPQSMFALESIMEDAAIAMGIDSTELRLKNYIDNTFVDPFTGARAYTCNLVKCVEEGKKLIKWDEKKKAYANQTGNLRRGIGMASFAYATNTFPHGVEISGARIVMNQDGSVQLQIGATEIGQGSDTAFAQIVSEVTGITIDNIAVLSCQDTEISPFDPGSFASRQTYVTGAAVHKTATQIREQILSWARLLTNHPEWSLDIVDNNVVLKHTGEVLISVAEIAVNSYYNQQHAAPIKADSSNNTRTNALAFGATFVEVEVDINLGKVKIIELFNLHDSGIIMNHKLAEGQVHGGVSMALGYALGEELLFDQKTGKPLNNNLLDYKLPTTMDSYNVTPVFIEEFEPTHPVGAKSLGENPVVSPSPAIRNAILHATGIKANELPMNPHRLFARFKEEGLI